MHNISRVVTLLIIGTILMASCSASEQTATNKAAYTPLANFDAGSYINPEDYGYDLKTSYYNTPESADTSLLNGKPVNSFIRVPFLFRMRTL